MNLDSKLQISLSKRSGNIVLRRDLSRLASASHLSEALHDLVSDGRLIRLGAGIYAKARPDASGDPQLLAPSDELVRRCWTDWESGFAAWIWSTRRARPRY